MNGWYLWAIGASLVAIVVMALVVFQRRMARGRLPSNGGVATVYGLAAGISAWTTVSIAYHVLRELTQPTLVDYLVLMTAMAITVGLIWRSMRFGRITGSGRSARH